MRYEEDHKATSRRRITCAARTVFAQVGFERATIDEIMIEAGMTRGGFYKHFSSKRALFVEVIRQAEVRVPEEIDCSAQDILKRYVDESHSNGGAEACPLFMFPTDVARQDGDVKEAYEAVALSIAAVLTKALPDGNRETALAMLAMSVGCMVLINSSQDPAFGDAVRTATLNQIKTHLAGA